LRRSFEIAGVGSLVTSLWEVNDAASRRWMELFYRSRLAGETDLQSAARKASLAMLGEQRKHGAVDPGAWGGFLATGR
jgi:CHAT domain-containing protein